MEYRCAKCNLKSNGSNRIEGGIIYLFCKTCSDILEDNPNITMISFLGPKQEMWVKKTERVSNNIKIAKWLREQGKSQWTKSE